MGTNCVKTKGLKKNIYIFYSKHISLKTTTSKKISLSLSKYNFQLLKKVYRYGVLHTTGSTKNSTSKKNKNYVFQILRKSYLSLNISIKLFLLRIRKHIK